MSHLVKQVSAGGVVIKSLDLLAKSCTKLGLQLHTDRKVAHYYGTSTANCDAVITIPGCNSEVAVFKQPDGTYTLQADHYHNQVTKAIGQGGANSDGLFQRYRAEELIEEARNDNWIVEESFNQQTQELQLQFSR
jgi:Protein of unknown function (DUF1257)